MQEAEERAIKARNSLNQDKIKEFNQMSNEYQKIDLDKKVK